MLIYNVLSISTFFLDARTMTTEKERMLGKKFEESKDRQTQWPNEKGQNDNQRSTKHTHETKDRVIRTPLKPGGELRCSRRVGSSCSTSVNLVTNPVTSHEYQVTVL